MTASCRDAGSSVLVEVPVPLNLREMKIQPSVPRVNVNSSLGSALEVVWSSSVTRLFRFCRTGETDVDLAPLPRAQSRTERRAEAIGVTLMGSQPSTGGSVVSCQASRRYLTKEGASTVRELRVFDWLRASTRSKCGRWGADG